MRYTKYFSIVTLFLIFVFSSCSQLQDDITLPTKVSVHGTDALVKASSSFHGKMLIDKSFDGCKQCHAQNFSGGTAEVSCATSNCHPAIIVHTKDLMNPSSSQFHGKFIASKKWDMSQCRQCHGSNYGGGVTSPSCYTCHKQPGGPEACNTCHGDFTSPLSIAPPRALNNAISTTDPGVGAHTIHIKDAKIGNTVACNECHVVPQKFSSAGHIDDTNRAEVIFGNLANFGPTKGDYNFTTFKCANTYCHGNFSLNQSTSKYPFAFSADKMTGNNFNAQWNKVDGTQGRCGTCHGLPPTGHIPFELKSCATCHTGIVDSKGNIIDSKKHINGKIDVFGESYSY